MPMIVKDFKNPSTVVDPDDVIAWARYAQDNGGSLSATVIEMGYPHDDVEDVCRRLEGAIEDIDRLGALHAHGARKISTDTAIRLATGINGARRRMRK